MSDESEPGVPNPENPFHRKGLVGLVHETLNGNFPDGWLDRCPDVACTLIYVLNQYGMNGYRIAAGRVEEVDSKKNVVLFEGTYTGTGKSEYHTWVVGPSGEKLDFSVLPTRYEVEYLWEDYVCLPKLNYIELEQTTLTVVELLTKRYEGRCTDTKFEKTQVNSVESHSQVLDDSPRDG